MGKEQKNIGQHDAVNHPLHYTDGGIETIDFIDAKGLSYCLGNAVKYISRAGKKDASKTIEDLQKAAWYLNHEIEQLQRRKADEAIDATDELDALLQKAAESIKAVGRVLSGEVEI